MPRSIISLCENREEDVGARCAVQYHPRHGVCHDIFVLVYHAQLVEQGEVYIAYVLGMIFVAECIVVHGVLGIGGSCIVNAIFVCRLYIQISVLPFLLFCL